MINLLKIIQCSKDKGIKDALKREIESLRNKFNVLHIKYRTLFDRDLELVKGYLPSQLRGLTKKELSLRTCCGPDNFYVLPSIISYICINEKVKNVIEKLHHELSVLQKQISELSID